jgi:hypothetical protein
MDVKGLKMCAEIAQLQLGDFAFNGLFCILLSSRIGVKHLLDEIGK